MSTGRDPVAKTIVADFARTYPHESNEQLSDRIHAAARKMGADLAGLITPEIVAKWRPEVSQ